MLSNIEAFTCFYSAHSEVHTKWSALKEAAQKMDDVPQVGQITDV